MPDSERRTRRAARSAAPLLAPLLAALLLAAPAAAWWFGPKFKSAWRQRPIVLDGDGATDWPQAERDDAGDMSFAFANDETDLYFMFAPHTHPAKAQLAGSYGQDLSVWVDPKAGMDRRYGVGITTPQKAGDDVVRIITAIGPDPARSHDIRVKAGILDEHGVLEGRVPLRLLGEPPPKVVTVGLEAAKPLHAPPPKSDPKGRSADELFAPVRIWVRVTLAKKTR